MITLDRLVNVLAGSGTRLAGGARGRDVMLRSLVVHDPTDPRPATGDVFLAVGVDSTAEAVDLAEQARAAVVLVRAPAPLEPAVSATAEHAGIAVVLADPEVSWSHLTGLGLRAGPRGPRDRVGPGPDRPVRPGRHPRRRAPRLLGRDRGPALPRAGLLELRRRRRHGALADHPGATAARSRPGALRRARGVPPPRRLRRAPVRRALRGARVRRAHGHRRARGPGAPRARCGSRPPCPSTTRAAASSRTAPGPPRCTCCARAPAPTWSVRWSPTWSPA